MHLPVTVFAPVSIGNVSVGFDSLGLALQPVDGAWLGDRVHVSAANEPAFTLLGRFADRLPADRESNIVWHVLQAFDAALVDRGGQPVPVHLTLYKDIPVCSGLGSSACSVVAAFAALNEFHDRPFNDDELLRLMGQAEAQISGSLHYDNVAPCFLGGMQLMLQDQSEVALSLPLFDELYWVLAYPDVLVSTQAARALLPPQYSRTTLIRFGQNLAAFVAACYRQDQALAMALLKDEIAEPYRAELLPDYHHTQTQLRAMGALAVGISGSGPTIFAACDDLALAQQQAAWLQQNYLQTEAGFVTICRADSQGTRTVEDQ
ncbi:homoserine kinase [Marinicella meishanensis]|uniref:homoserine kinase n=1 Tax=Marinicella meishanensis TaxID=2873263 RepID=UPI001CC0A928|nr:homoserine kinase [Marinicella sp. NBU2979]